MSLPRGLFDQFQVVHALILRETRTRFGEHQLGYIWALLEPILFAAPFMLIYTIAERSPPPGMSLIAFLITGIVPYNAFRSVHAKVGAAIDANRGLLFYPQVQPLDLSISRIILESATLMTSFMVVMLGEALVTGNFEVDSPLLVLAGLVLASLLGGGVGMTLGALSVYSPTVERISGPILRPLFWVSGIFFTANSLPEQVASVMSYNPVLHAVELVRTGWFVDYTSRYASIVYLSAWVLGFLFLGLALERSARAKLQF